MKQLRHVLALTLVFCMVFGMVTPSFAVSGEISVEEDYGIPVEEDDGIEIEVDTDREETSVIPKENETDEERNADAGESVYKYNIIHLDCGRKYFSVSSIEQIIDNAAAAGFNYIQLAVGNDGMRFLLDDMSLTVNGKTYDSDAVSSAIHKGNEAYYNFDVDELTQAEMDTIIAYASTKGMGVIPLINTPGHMDAILDAAEELTKTTCAYKNSARTIDVTNDTAVAFTKAFLQKYIEYFAGKGCTLFNMGADEYANDLGGPQFSTIQNGSGEVYRKYISYLNEVATNIKNAGMRPMAFNDGLYYNSKTSYGTLDSSIIVMYWSSGWGGYDVAPASFLARYFDMVNTHGDCYYVLKNGKINCNLSSINSFNVTSFMGSTIENPVGATFCIWCDEPGVATEDKVVSTSEAYIRAFGAKLPNSGTTPTEPTTPTEETVTVSVNQTVERTQDGVNNEDKVVRTELDESIATVVVTGKDAVEAQYTAAEVSYSTLAGNNSAYTKTKYYYPASDGKYYPVYAYKYNYYYYYGYSKTDSASDVTRINSSYYGNGKVTVHSQTTDAVPASTTIAITGVAVGTTYITVGDVRYTINVVAEDLTKVDPITVEYWITNARITGATSGNNELKITAASVYGEEGLAIADLVDATANKDGRNQEYWCSRILDTEHENYSTSGTDLQTTKNGDDETLNGNAFTKIRYYEGKWQVYTTEWTDVDRTQVTVRYTDDNSTSQTYIGDKNQLIAYYMEVVDIANANGSTELHVNAADWGTKGDGTGNWGYTPESSRCSVSIQLVYEDNSTNPTDTTATNLKSKTIVYGYWSQGRGLGTMIFSGEDNYEIYKVTAETGTMLSTTGSGNTVTVTSFTWEENEETVWEGDAQKSVGIGNPTGNPSYEAPYDNLAWNTSNYNKNNAILIRVYVKAGVTEDSLKVHYVDKGAGEEFYNYNITVASGTYFDSKFGMDEGTNTLVNNSVTNINGATQTVNADLTTMPEISAYYRYSDFTLDSVELSEDAKEVWLYYTFNNTHNFVVDFGVPLHLEPSDIGIGTASGTQTWDTAELTTGNKLNYGTADIATGEGLTYTPTSVMNGVETIGITLSDSTTQDPDAKPATHFIYLYPATNVLYEENVITNPEGSGWTKTGNGYTPKDNAGNSITYQATEKLGEENVHGYDVFYDENTGFGGGSAYVATLEAGNTQVSTKTALTFQFTGTGFDLISECGTDTGSLLVRLKDSHGNLKKGYFVDTYFTGDEKYITGNGILDYQVPVVRDLELDYGTYVAEIYGYMIKRNDASVASVYSLDSSESYLSQALKELGFDDDPSLYEVSYMDENSILNGGNGSEIDVVKSTSSLMTANMADELNVSLMDEEATQKGYVYVDGVRVYGTLENDPGYTASEKNVTYIDIYEIAKKDGNTVGTYLVYVEGKGNQATLSDYHNRGPENEIYLTSENTLAFKLDGYEPNQDNIKSVQISMRAVTDDASIESNGTDTLDIYTSTEMYYNVPVLKTTATDEYYIKITCPKEGTDKTVLSIGAIKLPEGVIITEATDTVKADVLKRAGTTDSDEFIPSIFSASAAESVKSGKKFSIGARTSTDVEKLLVTYQGTTYELTPSNAELVELGVADVYTYSYRFKAPNANECDSVTLTVRACKAGEPEVVSAPIELTIEIK